MLPKERRDLGLVRPSALGRARVEQDISRPSHQLIVEPAPERDPKAALRPLQHVGWNPRLDDLTEETLRRDTVAVASGRLTRGELDHAMVEQRAARFERVRHGRAI